MGMDWSFKANKLFDTVVPKEFALHA
jgi:hypothetical protein